MWGPPEPALGKGGTSCLIDKGLWSNPLGGLGMWCLKQMDKAHITEHSEQLKPGSPVRLRAQEIQQPRSGQVSGRPARRAQRPLVTRDARKGCGRCPQSREQPRGRGAYCQERKLIQVLASPQSWGVLEKSVPPTVAEGLSLLSPAPPDPRKVCTTTTHPLSMEEAGRGGERERVSLTDPQDSECP